MKFTDPQGRTLEVSSPDGSTPSEGELDQMFAQKYGGQQSPNPQSMAQQASQMPKGIGQPNQLPVQYTPRMMGVDASLNPQLVAQQKQAEIVGEMGNGTGVGTPQLQAQTELAKNTVAAQQKVAEENTTMDAFTNGLRELSKDYGKAYVNGYAGSSVNELWGKLASDGIIPPNGHEVGQKGYGAFESLQSTLIPSLNSVYSTSFGGQEPSSRIMSSLLQLAHKELPQLGKTIPTDEGKIQSGLQRFGTVLTGSLQYLKNNFNSQQLLDAYKKNPKILDQYAAQAFKNADSYQLSPEASQGLQDRYSKIIQPLEAAKQGKVVYDVPKEGNKTYIIPNGMAKDFEKEKGL